ncbi:uncharacterized protein MONOS_9288 [Monocercomonoides exilis]|uniref:uncharacterized protein n=1 Tax=Monocercomonoides exilis TaxID=2049356 RepID=UPI003559AE9D|nr:hypothetical protein MONOS_9288 [Monocercomonoides exilis]|eukprot:MONOS_9288.1-p1 / transcript=MONOS_9288.1 / gene=MONOS_9288 / organism=Monocercomonoides_exilis_PA203 / gene_product=unspecified product / transcript_product=unspecified product / location=Mono_scaffold00377:27452-30295(-) / protein_length=664 / sequence_SO=supercontig / SO=protein_coding / is_pseudo=false
MENEPYSEALVHHFRSRLVDYEEERAVFLLRFDMLQHLIDENYGRELECIEKEKEITTLLMKSNELKLNDFEQKRTVLEIKGDNSRLKGKVLENRTKLGRLLAAARPAGNTLASLGVRKGPKGSTGGGDINAFGYDEEGAMIHSVLPLPTKTTLVDQPEPFLQPSIVGRLRRRGVLGEKTPPRNRAEELEDAAMRTPSSSFVKRKMEEKYEKDMENEKRRKKYTPPRPLRETMNPIECFTPKQREKMKREKAMREMMEQQDQEILLAMSRSQNDRIENEKDDGDEEDEEEDTDREQQMEDAQSPSEAREPGLLQDDAEEDDTAAPRPRTQPPPKPFGMPNTLTSSKKVRIAQNTSPSQHTSRSTNSRSASSSSSSSVLTPSKRHQTPTPTFNLTRRSSSNSSSSQTPIKDLKKQTPVIVPSDTEDFRHFLPDDDYDRMMNQLAQLERTRKEKLRAFEKVALPLIQQRRALADQIEEAVEKHYKERLAAAEKEKSLRQALLSETKGYLSSRLAFQIKQRSLIEERELLRESSSAVSRDITAIQREITSSTSRMVTSFRAQTANQVKELKAEIAEEEEQARAIETAHTMNVVRVGEEKIGKLKSEIEALKEKEAEVRRRWKLDKEGLMNEKQLLKRRMDALGRAERMERIRTEREERREREKEEG